MSRLAMQWARSLAAGALLGLFVVGCPPRGIARQDHDSVFTKEGLLTARDGDLKSTVVAPHLEQPIQPDQNVLWCSTFQLAWNEACALIGEDVHLQKDPPMVAVLNKKAATKADIDAASFVALAGFVRDGVYQRIDRELERKFKGQATPRYNKPMGAVRPQDFVAYAYLFKNLEFPTPFQRLAEPLRFGETDVACFGAEGRSKKHAKLYRQVAILDYQSPDDFVIELTTKSKGDRFVLAKVAPGKDLAATIAAVAARAKAEPAPMLPGDVLRVPKLNFDVTRDYRELRGQKLKVKSRKVAKDIEILTALQNIRFQLDEKGVRLRSETHIAFGCAAAAPPQHLLVFDKPFLMLLQRVDAKAPYFALWVATPELLAR